MGMYTEIYVNVDLKPETPAEVIEVLKAMCGLSDELALSDKPDRWCMLFNSGSCYTPYTACKNMVYSGISAQWSLLGKGDIKNYNSEIEQFFEWLAPWIDAREGEFIGYMRYEEDLSPTLLFLPNTEALDGNPDFRKLNCIE